MPLRFPSTRLLKTLRQNAIPSLRTFIRAGQIASDEKAWQSLDISMTVASQDVVRFDIDGTGLWLIRATDALGNISHTAELWLRPNGTGTWMKFRSGNSTLGLTPFKYVEAKWNAAIGVTANLMYLRENTGNVSDGRILNP